ncbi:hypothetical protein [Beijerinckia indica]|nr:hypothetical protein [Beijerinckia indica]
MAQSWNSASASPSAEQSGSGTVVPLNIVPHPERSPVEIVRSIMTLQDQVVSGKKPVETAMPKIMSQMADHLLAQNPDVWKDPKNIEALITYLLSGGQSRVAKKILEIDTLPSEQRNLLEAVYAYITGHKTRAENLLATVDPQTLSALLGAHVALIKALLVAESDPAKAISYLDTARILAPGTLIEEAALRREIFLADSANKLSKFVFLSRQYIRRFHNSVYFDNFYKHFSAAIIHLGLADNVEQVAKLDDLIAEMKPGEQARIYLAIAYKSLINGRLPVASFVLAKASALTRETSSTPDQYKLYQASVDFLAGHAEKGLNTISQLDESNLTALDISLAHTILEIGGAIQSLDHESHSAQHAHAQPDASLVDHDDIQDLGELATRSIEATDRVLRGENL